MIKSFHCRESEKIFNRGFSRKIPGGIHRMGLRRLLLLDAAEALDDLRSPPGNKLERLHGDRKGQYSIRINDQWRICFEWKQGDAYCVEIVDYH